MFKPGISILAGSIAAIVAVCPPAPALALQNETPPATSPATAPTRVSSTEQARKLTKKVNPVYPKEAFDAKLTGVINLETIIAADGKVSSMRPLGGGNEMLIKAAEDAVKQWVYKPTKVNGMNVSVMTIVTINFKVGE